MKVTPPIVIGQRFHCLVVVGEPQKRHQGKWGRWFVDCRCDCGREVSLRITKSTGHPKAASCGCDRNNQVRKANTKHGYSKKKLRSGYSSWQAMIVRCENQKHPRYARYGGRGIRVCQRWRESFEAFLEDMGERPSHRHSIERKENDGDYCKDNCFWATPKQQANNRGNNVVIAFNGVERTLSQWAVYLSMRPGTLRERLSKGWSHERALTTSVRHRQ